jgi:predicted HNH restriction endonuclease
LEGARVRARDLSFTWFWADGKFYGWKRHLKGGKLRLVSRPQDQFNLMRAPSSSRYVVALKQVRAQITGLQWRMLEAHYLAPNHTASAQEIALAAGKTWSVTNLHYGRLATKIRLALDQPLAGGELQSAILAFLEPPNQSFPFWRWVMHASLATAIRDLGWFGAEDVGTNPIETGLDSRSAQEGEARRVLIIHRQRESSLRREHGGRLFCEVPGCGFEFEMIYRDLGSGFAEVHHLRPLSELSQPVSTTLADLAVVCANCHRMIHRNNDCRPLDGIIPTSTPQGIKRKRPSIIG